jgi:hypothetical protein
MNSACFRTVKDAIWKERFHYESRSTKAKSRDDTDPQKQSNKRKDGDDDWA